MAFDFSQGQPDSGSPTSGSTGFDFSQGQPDSQQTPQQGGGFLQKAGDFFGGILKAGADISGATAAVEGVAPLAQGIARIGSYLQPNTQGLGSKFRQAQASGPAVGEVMQKADTQGVGAAAKDIAGKGLTVAASAAPFAGGLGVNIPALSKLGIPTSFATKFPNVARYLGYAGTGAAYGATLGAGSALQNNKSIMPDLLKGAATGALVGVAVPAAVEGSVRAAKTIASLYSGVPTEVLTRAFQNPEVVSQAVKTYAADPSKVEEILTKANTSLSNNAKRNAGGSARGKAGRQ